jgi:hypothetical protein
VELDGDLAEAQLHSLQSCSGRLGGVTGILAVQQRIELHGKQRAIGCFIGRANWASVAVTASIGMQLLRNVAKVPVANPVPNSCGRKEKEYSILDILHPIPQDSFFKQFMHLA